MSLMIPANDMAGALVARDDGTGRYGLYKAAGPGWQNKGYLVITKVSKRAQRRVKWVETRDKAEAALDKFFPW